MMKSCPATCSRKPAAARLLRRGVLLVRVLAMCANCAASAQPAQPLVLPGQALRPGYQDAFAGTQADGLAWHDAEGIAPLRSPRALASRPWPAPMPSTPVPGTVSPPARPVPSKARKGQ